MAAPYIRKLVSELSSEDLDRFPVWEFALDEEGVDGRDDTTVRPVPVTGELAPSGLRVVRARFQLADGTEMRGYLTPRPEADPGVDSLQPVIAMHDGQLPLWFGVTPLPDDLPALYRRLGKASEIEVFPVHFSSDVPIAGGPIVGAVPGFMVLEDWRSNRVRVMK